MMKSMETSSRLPPSGAVLRLPPSGGTKKRILWPALAGYLAGLATAGVVAMLMPATPDAGPTGSAAGGSSTTMPPRPPAPTSPAASSPAGDPQNIAQHSAAPLSDEARGRIAPLEAKLAADPGDLLARKRLALALLQNQQLMAAYEHASQILGTHPGDPDGLYVHGVVRIAMGHAPQAIELLDRVLARYPNHALALRARAEAQRKIGDEGGAALTEERARQAARGAASAGGSEVDQLLAAASDGSLLEMMRSDSTGSPSSGGTAPAAADAEADGD